ncbi:nucleotidyltransferase domain-containing protein [Bacillus spongiae]|uniref:Nucleotidyltransferase domain-containing protein n=1 Tax=Bacillus spongiae TaxID=2683610 RepID=A0ABU8HB08_9BACI
MNRLKPTEAAAKIINKYFFQCDGAILAGSVVRNEATSTSDLDIVVFDANVPNAYRESLIDFNWPIEVFVHNFTSYKKFFQSDVERARPSLPRMVSEGVIIKGEGTVKEIKREAEEILTLGPEAWTEEMIDLKRYFITDELDNFIGTSNRKEALFIANSLAEKLHEFMLRVNGQWVGSSKWIVKSLTQYDPKIADDFIEAFDSFYRNDQKEKVIKLVDDFLTPYGGRLFDGFSIGKDS